MTLTFKRRKKSKHRYSGSGLFASKILCGDCGSFYGAKVWHSNSKYRRVIYQCNNKFKNSDKCKTPHLNEETIKELFVRTVNKLLINKNVILSNLELVKHKLTDTSGFDAKQRELKNEMIIVAEMIQKYVDQNARVPQNQEKYHQEYDGLVKRFEEARAEFSYVANQREEKRNKRVIIESFIKELRKQEGLISEFDKSLWYTLVDEVTCELAN